MSSPSSSPAQPVDLRRVFRLWLPLAASWLLMAAEQPMLTATVARMADEKIHLAAWGAVVFPIALVVEAPIIMLLAASTALCEDWVSYRKVRRFMLIAGGGLTAIHVLVAFTPLFDWVCEVLLDTPEEVREPARLGLQIMTPWTWAIAYRRFQQGVLIRFEKAHAVSEGTVLRMLAVTATLLAGYHLTSLPGIVVGSSAIAVGVTSEAVYSGWRVRGVVGRLRSSPPAREPLNRGRFLAFYIPLAVTPLVMLLLQPAGAAAMGRMPREIDSLAAWTPVYTLAFVFRSVGMGFNEVVVALLREPGAPAVLRRFTWMLVLGTSGCLALVALTPLASLWFGQVQSIPPELVGFSVIGVLIAVPMPAYQALQSWYQGILVSERRTRPITEAVLIYGVVAGAGCVAGAILQPIAGLHWALGTFVVAGVVQTAWLHYRSIGLARSLDS